MIIIDTREPETIKSALRTVKIAQGEKIIEYALPVGDILISSTNDSLPTNLAQYMGYVEQHSLNVCEVDEVLLNPQSAAIKSLCSISIVVERKTPADFLSSLGDNRLFNQAYGLNSFVKYPIILVTGEFLKTRDGHVSTGERSTDWNWWSLQMALMRLQLAGCVVMQIDDKEIAEYIEHLWRWLYGSPSWVRKPAVAPLIPLGDEAEFLCGIPGIGPARSVDILRYTGSVKDALFFLTNPDSIKLPNRPQGIGKAIIRQTRDFFGLGKKEVMVAVEEDSIDSGELSEENKIE